MQLKDEYFHSRGDQLKPIQPVVEIVLRYKEILPMAVASGSTKANVEFQLKTIGVLRYFDTVVTADDGIRPKPSPNIFIEAAKRLGVRRTRVRYLRMRTLDWKRLIDAGMLRDRCKMR